VVATGRVDVVVMGRLDVVVMGRLDDIEVEDGTLLETSTIELDSPVVK
jgi:hypothetical protein